ncbi:MAG TPA: hypothetical protein VLF67_00330 [Candidatus Saccharimonas sp.]|nr:hypothetical protein [Candidatus Saccharimonas sp.]
MGSNVIESWRVELLDRRVKFVYVSDFNGDVRITHNPNKPELKLIMNTDGILFVRPRRPSLTVVSMLSAAPRLRGAWCAPVVKDGRVTEIGKGQLGRLEFHAERMYDQPGLTDGPLLTVCTPPNCHVLLGSGITGKITEYDPLGIVTVWSWGYRPAPRQTVKV